MSQSPTLLRRLALVSGLLATVLFLLTPFLPVKQVQSHLHWPQQGLASVNAPLESYSPIALHAAVPLKESIAALRPEQNLLLSTLPQDSEDATSRGLFVRSFHGGLDVVVRDTVLLNLNAQEVASLPEHATLQVSTTDEHTSVEIEGAHRYSEELDQDKRPQITGIYTEMDEKKAQPAGLSVNVEINSRFTTSPSIWKSLAMYLGGLLTLISLVSLHLLDRQDVRGSQRMLRARTWIPRPLDGLVGGILLWWYFLGANTSDDGFILTMARASRSSGYMANYYRWFGVPESPFGAPYYDLLGVLSEISTASIWMRLPSLLAGLVSWFLISRMVLPILGEKIAARRVATWTSAFVFLSFWLAYNNGLRPEPIIALGALTTWVLFERALATDRLLPAALGTATAAFTLACGPTGLMAVAALLACLSGVLLIISRRVPADARVRGWLSLLAPFFAAGFSVLVAVFGDQTLMNVLESIHVRGEKGPSLKWYQEFSRYQSLMEQEVDGSFARRFAFFFLIVCFLLVVATILRNGKVPGSHRAPALRLVLIVVGTFFFMMFTPTKWTHHFGIFAGIGGALAALAAVSLSLIAMQSKRARTLSIGMILFVFAFSLSGTNGWWYISSYGVPWFDKTIQYKGVEAATIVLGISLVVLFIGTLQSFSSDLRQDSAVDNKPRFRFSGLAAAPLAIICALSVFFSLASLTKGFISQYPAYSVGLGNIRALGGKTCGLAENVLLETDSNDSFLTPLHTALGSSLDYEDNRGFESTKIPYLVQADIPETVSSSAMADSVAVEEGAEQDSSTEGGIRSETGINGSRSRLPFGLDYRRVPVVGSFTHDEQFYAETTTDWYHLPEASADHPLLVVSAAGRIEHYDINGVKQSGRSLVLEYGQDSNGKVTKLGETLLDDVGPSPSWRNLRLPLSQLPPEANVVRLHATDSSLDPEQWLAFTPPRVPELATLNSVVGSQAPVLMDWSVPLQFPCQRPFNHYAGVAEIPEYRISPDAGGRSSGTPFQDFAGGGVMGTAEAVNYDYQLPSYAKDDWLRDWGAIFVFSPRTNSIGEQPLLAHIDTEEITRPGWWYPGPMNIDTK